MTLLAVLLIVLSGFCGLNFSANIEATNPTVNVTAKLNNGQPSVKIKLGSYCIDHESHDIGIYSLISDCTKIFKKTQNHTIDYYSNFTEIVCCLASDLFETPSSYSSSSKCFDIFLESMYIEVVGESCIDEVSGIQGRFRWLKQCKFHQRTQIKVVYSCCVPVVCCPDFGVNPETLPKKKCVDYSRDVFIRKWELKGPYTSYQIGQCQNIYFIEGYEVDEREYPFMAALGYSNSVGEYEWSCGGTLISDEFVLTAAHCLISKDFGLVQAVRLGSISLNETAFSNDHFKDFTITERIPHPNYTRSSFYNDIALLRLNESVKFSSYIRPACLSDSIEIPDIVIAMGWGVTEVLGSKSDYLLQGKLEVFPYSKCNESYFINRKLHLGDNSQLCAGSKYSRTDTCQGDSGGPLVTQHNILFEMHSLHGITSIGILCGSFGTPGIYTRLYTFIEWIQCIVWTEVV